MPALSWPDPLPAYGSVRLRPFRDTDLALVAELATDPYIPLIGTVPAEFSPNSGLAYLHRQHRRLVDGLGYSFAVVDAVDDRALGQAGLWLHPPGPATGGYCLAPNARGRGRATDALRALTSFAWTLAEVHRVEVLVEPWNVASLGVAERCGYRCETLLSRHQEIGGVARDMVRLAVERRPMITLDAERRP